jgi:hypothetical protein
VESFDKRCIVTAPQLSVAVGSIARAAARPLASEHAKVSLSALAVSFTTGNSESRYRLNEGDCEHGITELTAPARVNPQSAESTYRVRIS